VKAEALLKFLADHVSIWRNGKKDSTWDIENRWQELKLSTVLDGITVTESYFYRLMPRVEDVVQYEVKRKKFRYQLNLEPLRQFQPQPKPTDAQRREKKLRKMRQQYAANREREKREELLQFLRQYQQMSVADLISTIEQQNSLKGENAAQ